MRSPVLPTVKENLQNPKALKVSGAAIQIRTGVHVPRSRLRGSPERPRIRMRFAQGMRSPVLPTVKEKPSKPKGFEGFWSCYPDSNWSPCPAEQAPREPGATSDQNALRAGDEVSSLSCNKKKCSETRKSRSIYGAAIQIRTGVHVPRSRLRGSPERPRIEMRFAQGDEVSSFAYGKRKTFKTRRL